MNRKPLTRLAGALLGTGLCFGLLANGITREVPKAKISGKVLLKGLGAPKEGIEVTFEPTSNASQSVSSDFRVMRVLTRADGTFNTPPMATGKYTINVSTSAHRFTEVRELIEGQNLDLDIAIEPIAPYIDLYATVRVATPSKPAELTLNGYGKDDSIQIVAHRLDPEELAKSSSIYSYASQSAKPESWKMGEKLLDDAHKIVNRDIEGAFTENVKLNLEKSGLYAVDIIYEHGSLKKRTWVNVTHIGLVVKEARGRALAYACDIEKGTPIHGFEIGAYKEGQFQKLGVTGTNGLARYALSNGGDAKIVMGRKGEEYAFVDTYPDDPHEGTLKMYLHTDRPVYRPGDQVQFRGIYRRLVGADYQVPSGGTVAIEIRDESETLVEKVSLPLSNNGTFHGSFKTNKESEPGSYSINTTYMGSEDYAEVQVSAYRKPDFEIKIDPEKPYYLKGDKVRMVIECAYYFGGPVQNAKVEATIYKSPSWSYGFGDDEYGYFSEEFESEYSDSYGDFVRTIELETDSSGRAVIEFGSNEAPEGGQSETWADYDQNFSVEANVSDSSGKYFSGSGRVKVVRSEAATMVMPSQYVVEPNKPVSVKVVAYNALDEKPLANRTVEVEGAFLSWDVDQDQRRVFSKQTFTTDERGEAVVSITPHHGGTFEVTATVKDEDGRVSRSSSTFWASGEYARSNHADLPDVELKLNKPAYMPGETCEMLIIGTEKGGTALVTLEGDRIHEAITIPTSEGTTAIKMPLKQSYGQVVFANICLVKSGSMVQRQKRVSIDLGTKKLDVSIRSDRTEYLPGENATYRITTLDELGRPVPAELAIGVVDESVYAIMEESGDIGRAFYPRGWNEVQTHYSFEAMYLDGGDKAPKNIQIRRDFRDTAYWNPTVVTNAGGTATVTLKLPDNLTTWRATAVGVASGTRVGQSTQKIKARKPLMVRVQAPRQFTKGDHQRIVVQVTNDSGKGADVHLDLAAPLSVKLSGDAKRTIRIANGATESAEWMAEITETGEHKFTARAWINDSINDGMELSLPVLPMGESIRESFAGDFQGRKSVVFDIRNNADPNTGGVQIAISPTIGSALIQSLDDLIDYPYGCVEQTMSRFLPAVVVAKGMRDAGLPQPTRAAELPQMINEGLKRLETMQHSDGSWGWWEFDAGDPGMTGYVLEGLAEAKSAGIEIPESLTNRAIEWGKNYCDKQLASEIESIGRISGDQEWWRAKDAREVYQLIAGLAAHGVKVAAIDSPALFANGKDDVQALAFAAIAMTRFGRSADADRLLTQIKSTANRSESMLDWHVANSYGEEATAAVLRAMRMANPDDADIPLVIRYLMTKRQGRSWYSTKDTSLILRELVALWERSGELRQTGAVEVRLNGKLMKTIAVNPQTLGEDALISVPIKALAKGKNALELSSNLASTAYYSLASYQVDDKPTVAAMSSLNGVTVTRRYFRLENTQLEDGSTKVLPNTSAVETAPAGDLIRVVIEVENKQPAAFVMLEDPIPSNCEISDRDDRMPYDEWSFWYSRMIIRDDRVAFFMSDLPAGKHTLSYVVRAENAGLANVRPTEFSLMYQPSSRAISASDQFEVSPK